MKYKCQFQNQHQKLDHISKAQSNTSVKKHVMREKVPFCQNFPIKIQEPEETNFLGDNFRKQKTSF